MGPVQMVKSWLEFLRREVSIRQFRSKIGRTGYDNKSVIRPAARTCCNWMLLKMRISH